MQASILVQQAERAIAQANPPMSRQNFRGQKGEKVVVPGDDLIKTTTLRDIRQAHDLIHDDKFEKLLVQVKEEMQPLTWKVLVDIGKQKRRAEAREEQDTRLSA